LALNEIESYDLKEKGSTFGHQILNPRYEILFDERASDILGVSKNFHCDENLNATLGFVGVIGGLLNIPTTNIIVSDDYSERREFIDFLFEQVPSSRVFEIYGDVKNEYKKDDFANISILRIHNFRRNIDLIERLTKANSKGLIYKGIEIPKLTLFADTEIKNIPPILKKNCLILEACGLDAILNLDEEKTKNFALREQRLKDVKQDPVKIETFLNSIKHDTRIDIPNRPNVEEYFKKNKAITRITLNQFLTIIRIIASLNQNKRDFFIIEEGGKSTKKVTLVHPIDILYAFSICKNCFKLSLDLPENYNFYFNYITEWLNHNSKVDIYKNDKFLPRKETEYFEGPSISKDFISYIKNHPEFNTYPKKQDTYRIMLLTLSDHPEKGKHNLLIFKPKKESETNTPNEYKLNYSYVIKPFNYAEVKKQYKSEYFEFCENLIENHQDSNINLKKSKLPKFG